MLDTQSLINIGISTGLAAIGWFARQMWEAVQDLREDIHNIEVKLPSHYVSKEDYNKTMERIELYVTKIFDKLDNKMDK